MNVYSHGVLVGNSRWDHGQTAEDTAGFEKSRVCRPKTTLLCACGQNFWYSVNSLADLRKHQHACPKAMAEVNAW